MIKAFRDNSPRIHDSAFVAEDALVIGDVSIGEFSSVWFGAIIRGDVNSITVGARTNIQDGTIIHVSSDHHPTNLGDEITVGHRVTLHGCTVEDGCLVGIGSILLDGVVIGERSLVAAGSLITPGTVIPPRSLVMGSPAKVRRTLREDELRKLDQSWRNYTLLLESYR